MSVDDVINGISSTMDDPGELDYIMANTGINAINTIGSFIISLGLGLLLIVFPIIVLLEVLYLNFSTLRGGVNKLMYSGKGSIQKVIKFTLRDAVKAYEEANTIETGNSANIIYLKIKIKAIIVVVVLSVLLMSGGDMIIRIVYSIMQELINLIKSIIV